MSKTFGWGFFFLFFSGAAFGALDTSRVYQDQYVKDALPQQGAFGYVKLANGDQLYVHVFNPQSDLEPIVFLNGLSQDLSDWKTLFPHLGQSKRPLIFLDNLYQGRSLKKYIADNEFRIPLTTPLGFEKQIYGESAVPFFRPVSVADQARDIFNLLEFLGVRGKFDLVGLSYGGGTALQLAADFPDHARKVMMLSPFVAPLETQDQMIRAQVSLIQKMFPLSKYSGPEYFDELYDFNLRKLVRSTYAISEPAIVRWGPLQLSGAYEMIRGIRHMQSEQLVTQVPNRSIHLVIAGEDQYIPEKMLMDFWNGMPAEKQASLLKVGGVEHKLNESVGPLIASYILAVTDGNWSEAGESLSVRPEVGVVKNSKGGEVARLQRSAPCEFLLMRPSHPYHPNLPVNRIVPEWMPQLPLSLGK